MASGPITSWEIDGETVETVSDFILGGSKITVAGDCSHEIKRRLLSGSKVMTNLDGIFKSRDLLCQQRSVSSRLYGSMEGINCPSRGKGALAQLACVSVSNHLGHH